MIRGHINGICNDSHQLWPATVSAGRKNRRNLKQYPLCCDIKYQAFKTKGEKGAIRPLFIM
ncbi:hypothetical protein [Klebsiella phage vB_KvaS_F2M1D]|nr:hypothetical protein [Klebsiella phage vB_KvaS_F2M1D]